MTWTSAITLAIAILGAVLGVINTWNAISQRRVRLRVRPLDVVTAGPSEIDFSIEVTNLSTFAVTIEEVGFYVARSRERLVVPRPVVFAGDWPRRLDSRESVSVYFGRADVWRTRRPIGKAYARTAYGEIAKGESGALAQMRRGEP